VATERLRSLFRNAKVRAREMIFRSARHARKVMTGKMSIEEVPEDIRPKVKEYIVKRAVSGDPRALGYLAKTLSGEPETFERHFADAVFERIEELSKKAFHEANPHAIKIVTELIKRYPDKTEEVIVKNADQIKGLVFTEGVPSVRNFLIEIAHTHPELFSEHFKDDIVRRALVEGNKQALMLLYLMSLHPYQESFSKLFLEEITNHINDLIRHALEKGNDLALELLARLAEKYPGAYRSVADELARRGIEKGDIRALYVTNVTAWENPEEFRKRYADIIIKNKEDIVRRAYERNDPQAIEFIHSLAAYYPEIFEEHFKEAVERYGREKKNEFAMDALRTYEIFKNRQRRRRK